MEGGGQGKFSRFLDKVLSEKYIKWYNSGQPVIPKKFKSKTITEENQKQIKTREELAIDKITCEANTMKIRSENYATKFARITNEIAKEIYKTYDEESEMAELLLQERKKDCGKEEQVSERIWKEKEEFIFKKELEENPENEENTAPSSSKISRNQDDWNR